MVDETKVALLETARQIDRDIATSSAAEDPENGHPHESVFRVVQYERSGVRKVTLAIVPYLFFMIFVNYLDRTNLSYAELKDDFRSELNLTKTIYGLGSGLFYFTYIVFQIPQNFLLGWMARPQLWLGFINIVWGLAGSAFAFIHSRGEFLIFRLILGMAEAGSFPGVWYYTSLFVPNQYVTMALAPIESATLFAQLLSAPAAMLIFRLHQLCGLQDWQWLFLVEGIPAVFLGVLMMAMMPGSPAAMRCLDEGERHAIEKALERQHGGQVRVSARAKLGIMMKNWKLQYVTVISTLRQLSFVCFLYFIPDFVQDAVLGGRDKAALSDEEQADVERAALWIVTLLWSLSVGAQFLVSYLAQRYQAREVLIGWSYIASGAALAGLLWMDDIGPVASTVLMGLGMTLSYGVLASITSMMIAYAAGPAADVSMAYYNGVSNIFGLLGPVLIGVCYDMTGSYGLVMLGYGLANVAAGVMALLAPRTQPHAF